MARSVEEFKSSLEGIIGFGATPFHDDFSIDEAALRQNAANLVETCNVIVPLGFNGEVFSLSPAEQKFVGRVVLEEVGGRKPVLVGIGACLSDARELAQAAEANGADGVLVLPPPGPKVNDDGLFEYFRSIAAAIKIGVVLFQTHTLIFSTALLQRLAKIPNIVGMKDEHGDLDHFVRQQAVVGERIELLCGVGEILAPSYFALGVRAFTTGIVNFMPRTPLRILELLRKKQTQEAAQIVAKEVIPVFDMRRKRPGYTTPVIKEAMHLCGHKVGPVRPPLLALAEADREELKSLLKRLGLLKT